MATRVSVPAAGVAPEVYRRLYPDWRAGQEKAVTAACRDNRSTTWVAEVGGEAIGFVAVVLHPESGVGEIHMIAVDPDHQRRGTGSALTDVALAWVRQAGMTVAMVETGGDQGHMPARRMYEKAGYTQLPIARYFKAL